MTPRILPVGLSSSLALQLLGWRNLENHNLASQKGSLTDAKPITEATFLSFCLRVSDFNDDFRKQT